MDKKFLKYARELIDNTPGLSRGGFAEAAKIHRNTAYLILDGAYKTAHKYEAALRDYIGQTTAHGQKMALIDEIEIKGANSFTKPQVVCQWRLPGTLFDQWPAAAPNDAAQPAAAYIKITPVTDNTATPAYRPGDYVFVDTQDRQGTPGGIYLLWDGVGSFIIRRCEPVPGSKPAKIALRPFDAQFTTHTVPYRDNMFAGRVIGHFIKAPA